MAGKMVLRRNFSFSVYSALRNYSIWREARKLDRMIRKGEQKSLKRQNVAKSTSMNEYARTVLFSPVSKRLAALNSVFMEHVCDLTSSGKHSEELTRLGIQIVKAKVSPNLNVLFLYWIHTKPIVEEEIKNFLPQVAGALRFELSALKVMGRVPEIRFVKDQIFLETETMEKLFDKIKWMRSAEEGALHENESKELEESEDEKAMKEEREKCKGEKVNAAHSLSFDEVLSKLQQNVYGLDYPKIVDNIMKQKGKREQDSLEQKTAAHVSTTDDEKVRFDKKALSRIIFKEVNDLRKIRRKNKVLMNVINNNESYEDDEDEIQEYQNYEEDEIYDEKYVDGQVKRMLEGDSRCEDEDHERGNK